VPSPPASVRNAACCYSNISEGRHERQGVKLLENRISAPLATTAPKSHSAGYSLADLTRHVIQRTVSPHLLS